MTTTLTRRQQRMLDQAAARGPEPLAAPALLMDEGEARATAAQIRAGLDGLRALIADFDEREGWKVLGYDSFRAWALAEVDQTSLRHIYRLRDAADVDRSLGVRVGDTPEAHARELKEVPPDQRLSILEQARYLAGDRPVQAKDIRRVIQEPLPITPPELTPLPDLEFRRYEPPIRETSDETALVRSLVAFLVARGEHVRAQVPCAAGVADVVSDQAVYEVKYWLTRDSFISAVGQVVLYRQSLNPALRAVVVGFLPSGGAMALNDLIRAAEHAGVEVLICNPS